MGLFALRAILAVILAASAGWRVHHREYGKATFYALIMLWSAP